MKRAVAAAIGATLLLCGCGSGLAAEPSGPPSSSPVVEKRPRLVGIGTVLDDGSGPEFCLQAVAQSRPPQCGGPPLVNWTWPDQGWEEASGTKWGDFAVVGTYDGVRFQVERTVDPQSVRQPSSEDIDFRLRCAEPAGGWRAPDPERATAADQQRVFAAAERLPGYADAWIDDRGDGTNDPAKVVVNVRVTGDVGEAERMLRKVWGGSLCVSKAKYAKADLASATERFVKGEGELATAPGSDRIDVAVLYDDGSLQRSLDREFGPGNVRVHSALWPYPG